MRLPTTLLAGACLLAGNLTTPAQTPSTKPGPADLGWPQFRGPGGQGHVTGPLPVTWSEKSHVAWSVDVAGKGWSSPVALDGLIWVTTAVPAKNGTQVLKAIAFDQATGKIQHDIDLFNVAKPQPLHARNGHASPTPVLGKGRLYAHFGSYGTACIDTVQGRVLWKNTDLQVNHETGPASSPLLLGDRLICCYDGSDQQYVAALNTATGEALWKTERPAAATRDKQSRRAFCTPLPITVNGEEQVVIPGAFCVYSYDPRTGQELWRVKVPGFSTVPRPVFAHGMVYVCTGFAPPELWAIRPDGHGDVTSTHVAWRYKKNAPNIPSPLIVGDLLFMIADAGSATCLDAQTGKLRWTERLGTTFSASPLASGSTIYAFGEDGKTVLFDAKETYHELGRNEIAGRQLATPAIDGGAMFIRTEQKLYKIVR